MSGSARGETACMAKVLVYSFIKIEIDILSFVCDCGRKTNMYVGNDVATYRKPIPCCPSTLASATALRHYMKAI